MFKCIYRWCHGPTFRVESTRERSPWSKWITVSTALACASWEMENIFSGSWSCDFHPSKGIFQGLYFVFRALDHFSHNHNRCAGLSSWTRSDQWVVWNDLTRWDQCVILVLKWRTTNTIVVFLLILSGNKADWCTNPSPRNVNRSHNSDTSSNCGKWVRGHTRNPAALLISHLNRTTQLSMHCLNSSHSRQLDSVIIKKESWLKKKKKLKTTVYKAF